MSLVEVNFGFLYGSGEWLRFAQNEDGPRIALRERVWTA